MTRWYDRPLNPRPKGVIETSLGNLMVEVYPDYKVVATPEDYITINRVEYKPVIEAKLNLRAEEWDIYLSDARRRNSYEVATRLAEQKIEKVFFPAIREWIENNPELIQQGHQIGIENLILRGRYKLDDLYKELDERKKRLDKILEEFQCTGQISDQDKRMLEDVFGASWRF